MLKQSVIFVIFAVVVFRLSKFLELSLPVVIDGYYRSDFKEVADIFRYVYCICHIVY